MGAYFSSPTLDEDVSQSQSFPSEVLDKYLVERIIGSGAFGVVYEVVDRRSQAKLAMKRVEGHSGAYSMEVRVYVWRRSIVAGLYIHVCKRIYSCMFP